MDTHARRWCQMRRGQSAARDGSSASIFTSAVGRVIRSAARFHHRSKFLRRLNDGERGSVAARRSRLVGETC
jgi:hypothetical protein